MALPAEFQTVAPILGTAHPTGYPTYVILGFVANFLLTPLGEPAFRMNVFSLLCVAFAAAVTMRLVLRLTGSVAVGMAAGVGLTTTPVAWNLATHADPHTLHLALVAVLFAALVRWEHARRDGQAMADRWLILAAGIFGLSAANHSLTLLLAVPVGLYVLSVQPGVIVRPRLFGVCLLALIGALVVPYLELPLRAADGPFKAALVYGRPDTWDGFWSIALAEQFRGSLADPLGDLPRKVGELGGLAAAQFGLLAALIPVGFLATVVRHPRFALLTGTAMLVTVLFNASYSNADIGRYYLGPVLWTWAWLGILAGIVVEQVGSERRRVGSARAVTATVLAGALLLPAAVDFGARSAAADRSGDTSARAWVTAALAGMEEDAVVVSWWGLSTVLWYARHVDGLRPDLTIIDDRTRLDLGYGEATDVIARFLGTRPVYVIRANDADLALVEARYVLMSISNEPAPDVYRVVRER
ncbi:MAG: hypothetical protein HW391_158 [Chloroflexi bacterium]|nr:hypothetical protein [Chloroflexota bacterium]